MPLHAKPMSAEAKHQNKQLSDLVNRNRLTLSKLHKAIDHLDKFGRDEKSAATSLRPASYPHHVPDVRSETCFLSKGEVPAAITLKIRL